MHNIRILDLCSSAGGMIDEPLSIAFYEDDPCKTAARTGFDPDAVGRDGVDLPNREIFGSNALNLVDVCLSQVRSEAADDGGGLRSRTRAGDKGRCDQAKGSAHKA
jgi:hypothetical protein